MSVSVPTLIADTRVLSGLRANQLFSNAQIAELLSDAYNQFRDKVNARFAFWFRKSYAFTIASGNTLDLLANVPDFQQAQYLNRLNNGVKETVTELGSIAERNQCAGGLGALGAGGRRYFIDGDQLELYPANIAAGSGSYELVYTPIGEVLAEGTARNIALTPVDNPITVGPNFGFSFNNGAFTSADLGAQLVVAFNAPNTAWSNTYQITAINSPTSVFVTPAGPNPSGFTSSPTGTITVVTQPAGTRGDLPQALTPWALYLKVHASLAIKRSRKQDTTALERQMAQLEQRIVTATKARTQGVQQAPWTPRRRGYGYGGSY